MFAKSLTHIQKIMGSQNMTFAEQLDQINQNLAPEIYVETIDEQNLIVWLNREQKRNAISFVMMDKLIDLAKAIQKWRQIRAVILAGKGTSFSTGIDLNDLSNKKNLPIVAWELLKPCQSKFQQVCLIWRTLPVPVIGVLHGHCLGAGLQLALATDIRIANLDCQFSIMESKWGLVADMGLTQSGFGVLRADVVKELAMTAKIFDSQQALDYGVISHLADDPMQKAKQLLDEIANRSPDAVLASKHIVNAMYPSSFCALYQEKLWQTKLILGKNRRLAVKKAKDQSIKFLKRQFG